MKKFLVAVIISPILSIGTANAQVVPDPDPDLLNSRERALGMHSWTNPEWTWMTESQASQMLRAMGYDVIVGLDRSGTAWRGKAISNSDSYHVVINRYAAVYGHLDRKSIARREAAEKAKGERHDLVATLNGGVALPISQFATDGRTPARPSATVMGEVCWTWMREDQAMQLLMGKGYSRIHSLRRGEHGNWEAKALKDDLALHVNVDWYGNTVDEPSGNGGFAQADPTPEISQ
jgi:hypothetical protein